MKIGIIGAMEEEIVAIKQKLQDFQSWTRGNIVFHQGTIEHHEIILIKSGIGKVQSALTTTLLIHEFHVEAIINTGSAGGIGKGLKIGDIILSNQTAYFDADVTGFGYKYGQLPEQPLYFETSRYLLASMEKAVSELKLPTSTGLILTGDSFVNDTDKIQNIKQRFPGALAIEMEGAAIAQVGRQFNIGVLVVRAISDTADEKATQNFDDFIIEAGKKSAELVLKFLEIVK
ncbi:MAG: 5'-methylthioadenosine/adenosylhomocysteine nucleosidase [Lactobacillales bacterium]|jgi:adenosylhomocysteine nucleosidase|nr:5'-methylthioadenosine/adenosylhomocysteine nucleosidase [Lactobacillales bacterium]